MVHRPWDPLRDLLDLQERINRLLEESLTRGQAVETGLPAPGWTPFADVCETPEAFLIQLEVPGVEREHVEIRAELRSVLVRGHRRSSSTNRVDNYLRMERSHGPFQRTFDLTDEIAPERVTAELRDGLLRIHLPKAEGQRGPRHIVARRAD
jgi:HSP20 family protein